MRVLYRIWPSGQRTAAIIRIQRLVVIVCVPYNGALLGSAQAGLLAGYVTTSLTAMITGQWSSEVFWVTVGLAMLATASFMLPIARAIAAPLWQSLGPVRPPRRRSKCLAKKIDLEPIIPEFRGPHMPWLFARPPLHRRHLRTF